MKILCFIDSLGSGGAQRQLVELAKGFKKQGHEVSFLVYHHETYYIDEIRANDIPYTCINESNYIKRILKIRKYIRNGNFDSVISFLEAANFITTISGLPYRNWRLIVGERSANPGIKKSVKLRFYRWVHLFTDYVVANSHENVKIVKQINPLIPNSKFKVIYNIVNNDIFKPVRNSGAKNENTLHILVAASHQYLKNGAGLVEAINTLSEENKLRIRINWYGDKSPDNSYDDLIALIEKYDLSNVFTFYKADKQIVEKMHSADVVGLFSLYEGLPNVICEAMVIGKPIIVSAISDIPGYLIENKSCLFNPNDHTDIAKSILYILSLTGDELQRIGQKNQQKGLELFNRENIIAQYTTLLTN